MTKRQNSWSVLWWVLWIILTILAFFVSCFFWTPIIAARVGSVREGAASLLWVTAVFGTWMVLLVPLIVAMYLKVDKAYDDARLRREAAELKAASSQHAFKWIGVSESDRLLPQKLAQKIKRFRAVLKEGHLVSAVLADGRRIDHVFVRGLRDVIGVYGRDGLDFRIRDIVDVEPCDLSHLADFKTERWLRLDGTVAESR